MEFQKTARRVGWWEPEARMVLRIASAEEATGFINRTEHSEQGHVQVHGAETAPPDKTSFIGHYLLLYSVTIFFTWFWEQG